LPVVKAPIFLFWLSNLLPAIQLVSLEHETKGYSKNEC